MCVRGRFNKLIKSARKHFHVFGAITKFKWKFVPSSRIFEYFIQRNQWKRKNDNWIEFNVKRIFRVVWWTKFWTFTNGTADKTNHRPQLTQINLATPQRPNKWKIILNSRLWMNLPCLHQILIASIERDSLISTIEYRASRRMKKLKFLST